MAKTKFTIEIVVRGDEDDADCAVDEALDMGALQEAIKDCGSTTLQVLSATCTRAEPIDEDGSDDE